MNILNKTKGVAVINISSNFTGGNICVVKIDGDEILLENELRDTDGDWFYWAFFVEGAGGKTLKFKFNQPNRVGYYGAAVSHDLEKWEWSLGKGDGESFTYSFAEHEDKVYFAHHMLYHPKRFSELLKRLNIQQDCLCVSEKGNDVPCVQLGDGDKYILLTARHHSCESTGNYALEGVLEAFAASPLEGYRVFCVPFVDYDGVVCGDQGKSRKPYDHNRDYNLQKPALYKSVAAIREFADTHNVVFGFDFHSPWHCGGENDKVFIPQKGIRYIKSLNRFAELFERACTEQKLPCMQYRQKDDHLPEIGWNRNVVNAPCFANWIFKLDCSDIAFTLETAYFGTDEARFSQSKAVNTGRAMYAALQEYTANDERDGKITFTGDLLCYPDMTAACTTASGYNYNEIFKELKKVFTASDCVVGNLETVTAGRDLGYTEERYSFNSPDEFLLAAATAGVDTFCLANNHCMDRGEQGIINTVGVCDKYILDHIGAYASRQDAQRLFIKNIRGTRIALLNYTYGTNAFAHHTFLSDGHEYMVNLTQPQETREGCINLLAAPEEIAARTAEYYDGDSPVFHTVLKPYLDAIEADIKRASQMADIVVFCLHSGGQYNEKPDAYTRLLCQRIKSFGADIIVANHPHIIHPCEITDGFLTSFCQGNTVYSQNAVTVETPVDKQFSTLLHIYTRNKQISSVFFSLMKLDTQNGVPRCRDTFELYGDGLIQKSEILKAASLYAGRRIDNVEKEYRLL